MTLHSLALDQSALLTESSHTLMQTYRPLPIRFVRGEGMCLWDDHGNAYLDCVAGVAVTNVGHSHPRITEAIQDQAGLLLHTSNHYSIEWQNRLADQLIRHSGMERVFFGNSGGEANEAAFKLARLYAQRRGIKEPKIVVMDNAFHGRSFSMISASDSPSVRQGFGALLSDFVRVPFGDLVALEEVTQHFGSDIVAVLAEPIQGEAGVIVPPTGYLKALRAHCTQYQWLLMLDEIQTGLGRTGTWFAYQHENILPDVVTLAKALANGLPIGACLASGIAAELFTPGSHGSTFGGNPLACRVGCTVLEVLEEERLLKNAAHQGRRLKALLEKKISHLPRVKAIRGHGLMIGIELNGSCRPLMQRALETHRLLINVTRDTTIRLLPPLIINDQAIDELVKALHKLITQAS
jgi:acetylornithine aminotransferase